MLLNDSLVLAQSSNSFLALAVFVLTFTIWTNSAEMSQRQIVTPAEPNCFLYDLISLTHCCGSILARPLYLIVLLH